MKAFASDELLELRASNGILRSLVRQAIKLLRLQNSLADNGVWNQERDRWLRDAELELKDEGATR